MYIFLWVLQKWLEKISASYNQFMMVDSYEEVDNVDGNEDKGIDGNEDKGIDGNEDCGNDNDDNDHEV